MIIFFILLLASAVPAGALEISTQEQTLLAERIFNNECGGKTSALLSWNSGEEFCSLGIAHFIWFPAGSDVPFHESFPDLVAFCTAHGHTSPEWLTFPCPWPDRQSFLDDRDSPRMNQLRDFIVNTRDLQAAFLIDRLEKTVPLLQAKSEKPITANIDRLIRTPRGRYALVDYLNFKGSGLDPAEQYKGQGWGLLQVLENMDPETGDPCRAFSEAAAVVLKQRVKNSPPARNEHRWLNGWLKRTSTYPARAGSH